MIYRARTKHIAAVAVVAAAALAFATNNLSAQTAHNRAVEVNATANPDAVARGGGPADMPGLHSLFGFTDRVSVLDKLIEDDRNNTRFSTEPEAGRLVYDPLAVEKVFWEQGRSKEAAIAALPPENQPYLWKSQPPIDIPFEPSDAFKQGLIFTGRGGSFEQSTQGMKIMNPWNPNVEHERHRMADIRQATWADDGNLYSVWADGTMKDREGRGWFGHGWGGGRCTYGVCAIEGDDPTDLDLTNLTVPLPEFNAYPWRSRYPTATLFHDGKLYCSSFVLENSTERRDLFDPFVGKSGKARPANYDLLGPMGKFHVSDDFGATFRPKTLHYEFEPMFPETREVVPGNIGKPVTASGTLRFGTPHWVDFGKGMEHSPDGKAYLLGMGALEDDPKPRPVNLSWISADQLFLARVDPSPETINDLGAWEFVAGLDESGKAKWTKEFKEIKPMVDWNNNMGRSTITYNAPLKKYFLTVTDGWPTIGPKRTYILESDNVYGPWKLVTYMHHFGPSAYFVHLPSKFISDDGLTMWIAYSNNYSLPAVMPHHSVYGLVLVEVQLRKR